MIRTKANAERLAKKIITRKAAGKESYSLYPRCCSKFYYMVMRAENQYHRHVAAIKADIWSKRSRDIVPILY